MQKLKEKKQSKSTKSERHTTYQRWILIGISFFLVAAILGTVLFYNDMRGKNLRDVFNFSTSTPTPSDTVVMTPTPTTNPDVYAAGQLAYIKETFEKIPVTTTIDINISTPENETKTEFTSKFDIWISNADGSSTRQLTSTGDYHGITGWSPDNSYILAEKGDDQVYIDAKLGIVTILPRLESNKYSNYFWGENDKIYYINHNYDLVQVIPTSKRQVVTKASRDFKNLGLNYIDDVNGKELSVLTDNRVPDLPSSMLKVYLYSYKTGKLITLESRNASKYAWINNRAWITKEGNAEAGWAYTYYSFDANGKNKREEKIPLTVQSAQEFLINQNFSKIAFTYNFNSDKYQEGTFLYDTKSGTIVRIGPNGYLNNGSFSRDNRFLLQFIPTNDDEGNYITTDIANKKSTTLCDQSCFDYKWQE